MSIELERGIRGRSELCGGRLLVRREFSTFTRAVRIEIVESSAGEMVIGGSELKPMVGGDWVCVCC